MDLANRNPTSYNRCLGINKTGHNKIKHKKILYIEKIIFESAIGTIKEGKSKRTVTISSNHNSHPKIL